MQDVEGRVAFITGGSSGIGRGIALAFARAGMKVVVTGRRRQHLDESAALFAAEGLEVPAVQLDVTDRDAVFRAASMPYMSPIEAGERVLAGVQRNDLFILTHPEFRDGVAERAEMLLNAFPDEPLNVERAAAITFLTSHPVYSSRTISGKGPARSSGAAGA